MATRTANNKTYYINPAYLTFVENSGYGANLIQVSASSSCYISVYDPSNGINYSDADKNYLRWKVTAYNNKFPDNEAWKIYVRLERDGSSALVMYDHDELGIHGGKIEEKTDEQGNVTKVEGEYDPNHPYWYIRIGDVSATNGTTIREITYDTGYLVSDRGLNDANDLNDMWELDKYNTPWLIRAKQWLADFTVKGFIKFIGGFKFSKGKEGDEKIITDIKRSIDSDYEFLTDDKGNELKDENGNPIPNPDYVPVSDETIPTTAWVAEKFSGITDDKYLRKDQPDRTPHDLAVGGVLSAETSILFQEKQISGFIRYYDEPRSEVVTDVDVYSALMTEHRIEEQFKSIDDRYIRKDKEDTAHKHITFEEGITVYQLAKMMNLEVTELATIARAIVDILGSAKFVDGFAGEGYQIWKSIATGDWCFTIDRLTVRKVMTIYELIIQKIRSVGGMIVVSAGNGKIKEVTEEGLEYRISFEDTNTFTENDLMRCQVWTGTGVKYYWVEVVRVVDDCVYARKADFAGVVPEVGDEVVLMGNTKNKLRQSLLLLSATEDGQPRFDCLDGIHDKNFDGCLRTRVGCLDGISDEQFPAGLQPQGYGLYADNCYLRGVFVLSTGVDVQTQFSIMEGQIRASLSSVQQQINAEDNYLSNASFTADMGKWQYANDVRAYTTSGGLLFLNDNLYTEKKKFAGIVVEQDKNVLQIINGYIVQKYEDYAMYPDFSEVEQTATDEEGNEVGTGVMLYRPRMFYASFKCMVAQRGVLKIYFEGEETRDDFEEYEPLYCEKELDETSSFETFEWAGKWNGTGNFRLEFTGQIFLYDVALADDKLADMEERWSSRLEITEKQVQLNLEHINQQGEDLEEYRSEYLRTAEEAKSRFTAIEDKAESDYRALSGEVKQTASDLTVEYKAYVGDTKDDITESYTNYVNTTAAGTEQRLTAYVDDTEAGITSAYTSAINTKAGQVSANLEGQITDLKNGDIKTMKTSISANTNAISTKVSQTDFNALSGTVSNHETRISQNANNITATANKIKTDSSGNITNISTSGLVLDSEFASLFSTQVNSQGIAKTASLTAYVAKTELGDMVSKLEISADQINLKGQVEFEDLASGVQSTINGKVNTSTIISGNHIITSLINADELVVKKFQAISSGYTYSLDANGFNITDSSGTNLCGMYISSSFGYFRMAKGSDYFTMSADSLMYAGSTGVVSLSSTGLYLGTDAKISGLAIGNIDSRPYVSSDLVVTGSDISLPSPSSCPGKIMFVKTTKAVTISGSIIGWSSSSSSSSVKADGAWALIFVSDGSYWYGFSCR